MADKFYTIDEAKSILLKATQEKLNGFAKQIQSMRERELSKLSKAAIPPHKHNQGMQASAAAEDVPPGKINGKGIDKAEDEAPKQTHENHTCTSCGRQNTKVTEVAQGKGPAAWHCPSCVKKSAMEGNAPLCKKCNKSHKALEKCGEMIEQVSKADLVDAKGKRSDNHTDPKSKLPDDAKSKVIEAEGSGGEMKKASWPGHAPSGKDHWTERPNSSKEGIEFDARRALRDKEGRKTLPDAAEVKGKTARQISGDDEVKKNAQPPMAKPPSGKNMGTSVPTSAPKPPAAPKAPTMKSVDKIVVHDSKASKPPKDADYKSKQDGKDAVYEAKKPEELEKGVLAPMPKPKMDVKQGYAYEHEEQPTQTQPTKPLPTGNAKRGDAPQATELFPTTWKPGQNITATSLNPQTAQPLASPKAAGVTRPGIFGKLGKEEKWQVKPVSQAQPAQSPDANRQKRLKQQDAKEADGSKSKDFRALGTHLKAEK